MSMPIISKTQTIIFSKPNQFDKLPKDIWHIIVNYLAADSQLKHLVSLACVSKVFYFFCLSHTQLRIPNAFITLNALASSQANSRQPQPFLLNKIFDEKSSQDKAMSSRQTLIKRRNSLFQNHGQHKLLSVDEKGRHYFCSVWPDSHFTLYIMNPENCTFELVQDPQFEQRIVSCHPITDGFILVTHSGYSLWKYINQKPVVQSFQSLFKNCSPDNAIVFSSFQSGQLLFQTQDSKIYLSHLKTPHLYFNLYDSDNLVALFKHQGLEGPKRIVNLSGQHYLSVKPGIFIEIQICEMDSKWYMDTEGKYLKVNQSFIKPDYPSVNTPNWTLIQVAREEKLASLYVIKQNRVWIGREFNLKAPNPNLNEHCLLYQDFLFLKYQNNGLLLIYLPSRKEYSLKCYALEKYLNEKNISLQWVSLKFDKEIPFLHILFRKKNESDFFMKIFQLS